MKRARFGRIVTIASGAGDEGDAAMKAQAHAGSIASRVGQASGRLPSSMA
jgi:hypothetical protein